MTRSTAWCSGTRCRVSGWRIAEVTTGKAGKRAYLPDEMVAVPNDTDVTPPAVERAIAARKEVEVGRTTRRLQLEARQLESQNMVNTLPKKRKRAAARPARFQ